MWEDPIVSEVRKVREDLAKRSNYDLHIILQNMRDREKRQKLR